MNNLEIYDLYGFKFFLCKADKSPDTPGNWKDKTNHINREQAETYQQTGHMIGAWIPENVIVIDLDRHEGKEDGVKTMNDIKKEYKIEYSIIENTFTVKTSGKGLHLFYTVDKEFRQNNKAPAVDLKTNKGYVIAAGSPGYEVIHDNEPAPLPFELEQWLFDCDKRDEKKPEKENGIDKEKENKKKLPAKSLKSILKKIDVSHFNENDRWLEFVMSCLATAGNEPEIHDIIDEWSKTDPAYSSDKSISKRIESFQEITEITTGSFIHFLREENISQYIINQVVKLDSISSTLINAENSEIELPFCDPDYNKLAKAPAAKEFFEMQGNTAAAAILNIALENKVLYNDAETSSFYYDGNRWIEFQDFYGIIYTIIFRVIKIVYNKTEGEKEDNNRMFKCVAAINKTRWKQMTWTEFCYKESIYKENVKWDSPEITETITLIDGIIDFKKGKMEIKKGNYYDYRRSYFGYTCNEILEAKEPGIFIKFFDSLFPDEKTRETTKYCISMSISGNAGKRLFQLWQGIGRNGKTTLLETLKHVLGEEKSYKFPPEILISGVKKENYKSEIAKFRGKYFCYTTEVEKGARLSQNLIKALTGDDTIAGRHLYKEGIEFESTWQVVYAVNDLPAFYGDDYAFVDRLLVIPFNMFFWKTKEKKEQVIKKGIKEKYLIKANDSKEFKNSLWSERAGIIKWMIDNYNHLNNNLEGIIPESPECILKKTKYVDDNDEIGIFIKEVCEIDGTGSKGWFTPLKNLADTFRDFTGYYKWSTISIIKGIRETHDILIDGSKRIKRKDEKGIEKIRQTKILKNIIIKDEQENFENENEQEKLLIDDLNDEDLNDEDLKEEIPF